jgi:hypothetical protein
LFHNIGDTADTVITFSSKVMEEYSKDEFILFEIARDMYPVQGMDMDIYPTKISPSIYILGDQERNTD